MLAPSLCWRHAKGRSGVNLKFKDLRGFAESMFGLDVQPILMLTARTPVTVLAKHHTTYPLLN